MRVRVRAMMLASVAACLGAAPAFAHHSFAMFDDTHYVTLDGTVKEFQWTNPHSWLQLDVRDPKTGKMTEWSIETGSVTGLSRQGWHKDSAKPGDHAVVKIQVMKDGSPGGSLHMMTIDGKPPLFTSR